MKGYLNLLEITQEMNDLFCPYIRNTILPLYKLNFSFVLGFGLYGSVFIFPILTDIFHMMVFIFHIELRIL